MAEILTPNTTVSLIGYEVRSLLLDWPRARISVWLKNPTGQVEAVTYNGERALSLMRALNTANLSVKSLQRRILEVLSSDGRLPSGSVTGAPD